jgi:hypothetical protein
MNGGFDFGILILGLGALAFLAGLGTWTWECIKKPNAPEPAQNTVEHYASDPSAKTLEDTLAPEIQTAPLELLQPPHLPTPPVTTLPSPLAQPAPIPPPPPPSLEIQEVELKQEHVDNDPSYEATLAEVQEADPPELPPAPLSTESLTSDENEKDFLLCTGTAFWFSEDGGKTTATIGRAIFRDSFHTLRLALKYNNRDWPKEVTMRRDTTTSYTGQAGTESTNVHCQLIFKSLSGTKIEFKGLWYAYRTDTQACETFSVTGEIHSADQAPGVFTASVDPIQVRASLLPRAKPRNEESAKRIAIPGRRFSLAFANFHGNPFLEILENGSPWGESHPGARRHFSFGKRKARMVLAARNQIRSFVDNTGSNPATLNAQVEANPWLEGTVAITGHEFFRVKQREIRSPFLQLTFGRESFSFGLSKAEALLHLLPTIEKWIKSSADA